MEENRKKKDLRRKFTISLAVALVVSVVIAAACIIFIKSNPLNSAPESSETSEEDDSFDWDQWEKDLEAARAAAGLE